MNTCEKAPEDDVSDDIICSAHVVRMGDDVTRICQNAKHGHRMGPALRMTHRV